MPHHPAPWPSGVFAGLATLDVVHAVERLPGPDEKVDAASTVLAAGGPAANAAKTFAALGGRATLLTALGGDAAAALVRAELEGFGVRVVDLAAPDAQAAVASVLVTRATGARAVVGGPAPALPAAPDIAGELAGASVLLLDGHHPGLALAAARVARAAGVPVVADAGRPRPVWAALLPLVDTAICSAAFRVADEPDAAATAAAALALGVRRVAITAGPAPLHWWDAEGRRGRVAPPVVVAVDTLGAGDVLHGAFCLEAARGRGFADALATAAALAARRCAHPGLDSWLRRLTGPAA